MGESKWYHTVESDDPLLLEDLEIWEEDGKWWYQYGLRGYYEAMVEFIHGPFGSEDVALRDARNFGEEDG